MPLQRVSIPSPFYSSRGGAKVTTIVLHTAEGARTYQSLGSWFQNPTANVSSHVGIDDTPNTVGEYVPRSGKAWTQGDANPYCVSAELCGFASWDNAEWNRHPTMLANCAAWIAEEAAAFAIPITKLSPAQAQSPNVPGVCQHIDLAQMGGGHVDCGPAFTAPGGPYDQILAMAAGGAAPTPKPPEAPDMIPAPLSFVMNGNHQAFWVDDAGNLLHCYAPPGKGWTKENLGPGWNKDTGLSAGTGPAPGAGPDRVFGVRADGKRAQCYWTGKEWMTQPLP